MRQARFGPTLLLLFAIGVSSCDDAPLSSSITRSGSSPSPVMNLTGIWSGTAIDSSGVVEMLWQLTQNAGNVTGTVRASTNVGLPLYTGSVAGTLAAGVLTFTVTVPRGSIPELPECSLALTGSATDVQASSMAGIYTGTHSCQGAVEGGRFVFVKQ